MYLFPDPCVVTNAEIRSNDNVTYAYEPSSCWTLTSASCGPTPTFAVFSRKGSSGAKLDVVVMVGGHKVDNRLYFNLSVLINLIIIELIIFQ